MQLKKMKAAFVSIILSLSLAAELFFPAAPALAEGETGEASSAGTIDGLCAYWNFNDNYQESLAGLTTNLGGGNLSFTEGVYDNAAVFNGTDNYLYVDASPVLNLGNSYTENNDNFTISAWLNLGDSKGGLKYFLDKGMNWGSRNKDNFYWSNPYRIYFDTSKAYVELSNVFKDYGVKPQIATDGFSRTTGKSVDGEEWFLYTVTYDGKVVKVYVDNQLLMQSNYTNGITFNNDQLFIGVDCALKNFFKGAIDDLRLYTRALSYDNVSELYKQGLLSNKELVEPTKQLVAYYPFDGDLMDVSVFNNDAEKVEVSGTTKYVMGMNGKGITMSGGNYIRIPAGTQLNFDNEFTLSFWLKVDEDGTYPILYRQNPSCLENDDNGWTYNIYLGTWAKNASSNITLRTKVYDPAAWGTVNGSTLTSPFDYKTKKVMSSKWFHYAFTYKDGQIKSFLNGVLQKKTDSSKIVNISNASGDLLIGYDNKTFLNGAIDELKIFNKCLTETEVNTEANRVDYIILSNGDANAVASIGKGKSVTISSIVFYDIDEDKYSTIKLSNKNFTFKSSNKKIFKVTSDGKITAVKAGKAKLTITYGCHSVTYEIKVK